MSAKKIFKADFHSHTFHSIDSLSKVEDVLSAAVKKGLNAIAITDHNEIDGAFEAARIAKERKLALQVIIGEEVMCKEGDLLVYFLKKRIAPGKLADVLKEVKRQGAVCCAAHPYDFTRSGINLEALQPALIAQIDMIEAFNARVMAHPQNERAAAFAQERMMPVLAGSDSHHPSEVGTAYVEFQGIRKLTAKSILSAGRKIGGKRSPMHVKLFTRYAVFRKRIMGKIRKP